MQDKNAMDQLMEAARELCSSSKEHGVDTRSALAGGALGILLSSKHGRGLFGKVLKYGVVAGLGALAWQASREREHGPVYRTPQPYDYGPKPDTAHDDSPRTTPPPSDSTIP